MSRRKLLFISFIAVQVILGGFLLINAPNTAWADTGPSCFDNAECESHSTASGHQHNCVFSDPNDPNSGTCQDTSAPGNTYSCDVSGSSCVPIEINCDLGYKANCGQYNGNPLACQSLVDAPCEPMTCTLDVECPSGTSCRNGTCLDKEGECVDNTDCAPGGSDRGDYQYSCRGYDYDGDGTIRQGEQYCRQVTCDNSGGSLCAEGFVCWEDQNVCEVSQPGECDESNPCPNYYECNLSTQQCELTVENLSDPLIEGTYSCKWVTDLGPGDISRSACITVDYDCNTGYVPEQRCEDITDPDACGAVTTQDCVPEEEAAGGTSSCAWFQIEQKCYTRNNCDPGYEPRSNCENITTEKYGDSAYDLCVQSSTPQNCIETGLAGVGEECQNHDYCQDRLSCVSFKCTVSGVGSPCNEDRNCPDRLYCSADGICTADDCREGGLVPCGGVSCPCTFCDFFELIHNIVEFLLFTLGPILASLMIVVGGFYVLTSAGNQGKYRKGKEYIKWALLGYLLMLGAWLIINTILTMLDLADWVSIGDWWKPNC
ncbi:MAG: pilin [Candidatus Spechtbacterales bacterium]|nr:pilin [Candidatus Spechtbacterales bacterium]